MHFASQHSPCSHNVTWTTENLFTTSLYKSLHISYKIHKKAMILQTTTIGINLYQFWLQLPRQRFRLIVFESNSFWLSRSVVTTTQYRQERCESAKKFQRSRSKGSVLCIFILTRFPRLSRAKQSAMVNASFDHGND